MHNLLLIPCTLKDETSLYIERWEKLKYDEEETSLYIEREKKISLWHYKGDLYIER